MSLFCELNVPKEWSHFFEQLMKMNQEDQSMVKVTLNVYYYEDITIGHASRPDFQWDQSLETCVNEVPRIRNCMYDEGMVPTIDCKNI